MRAHAFVLRLWETERLQGEASRNAAHVRTRTDSQKKKRREVGVGGGGRRRTEVNINLRGPKESLPAARLDAHLFRQSGASSRILANNISSASFSFFAEALPLLIFGFCCRSRVSDTCRRGPFFFADVLVFVYRGPGVHPSASARKRDPSIPREMCFLVAEAGTRLVAG